MMGKWGVFSPLFFATASDSPLLWLSSAVALNGVAAISVLLCFSLFMGCIENCCCFGLAVGAIEGAFVNIPLFPHFFLLLDQWLYTRAPQPSLCSHASLLHKYLHVFFFFACCGKGLHSPSHSMPSQGGFHIAAGFSGRTRCRMSALKAQK